MPQAGGKTVLNVCPPTSPREHNWYLWSGAAKKKSKELAANNLSYAKLHKELEPEDETTEDGKSEEEEDTRSELHKQLYQIDLDLERTWPEHEYIRSKNGQAQLRRLLKAWVVLRPSVGYYQSMNFVAAWLLTALSSEEQAFWVMVSIFEDIFPAYYNPEMVGIRTLVDKFTTLVTKELPTFHKCSQDNFGIPSGFRAYSWFLSLFFSALSPEALLRVWDFILYQHYNSKSPSLPAQEAHSSASSPTTPKQKHRRVSSGHLEALGLLGGETEDSVFSDLFRSPQPLRASLTSLASPILPKEPLANLPTNSPGVLKNSTHAEAVLCCVGLALLQRKEPAMAQAKDCLEAGTIIQCTELDLSAEDLEQLAFASQFQLDKIAGFLGKNSDYISQAQTPVKKTRVPKVAQTEPKRRRTGLFSFKRKRASKPTSVVEKENQDVGNTVRMATSKRKSASTPKAKRKRKKVSGRSVPATEPRRSKRKFRLIGKSVKSTALQPIALQSMTEEPLFSPENSKMH